MKKKKLKTLTQNSYSGMCVWYDTTSGIRSSLAYTIAAKTIIPGALTWMTSGLRATRRASTRRLTPKESSSVGEL